MTADPADDAFDPDALYAWQNRHAHQPIETIPLWEDECESAESHVRSDRTSTDAAGTKNISDSTDATSAE